MTGSGLVVLAIARAVVCSWRNRLVQVLGGRAQYRAVTSGVLVLAVGLEGVLARLAFGGGGGGSPTMPDALVYPSLGAVAVVIGLALAALVTFLMPERGELDTLLAGTAATPGMRRFGQELPVVLALSALAALICIPLAASLSGRRPEAGAVAVTAVGSLLLVLLGLTVGRVTFVLAQLALQRVHVRGVAGRGGAAVGTLLLASAMLRLTRPGGSGLEQVDAVLRAVLVPVLGPRPLTPVLWAACLALVLIVARVSFSLRPLDQSAATTAGVAVAVPPAAFRRWPLLTATIASAGRDAMVCLWCLLAVLSPLGLALVEELTGSPFLVFAPYLLVLPALTTGYVYGATVGLRCLLAGAGLSARQWFLPQAGAALLLAGGVLLCQAVVGDMVGGLPLGSLSVTVPLAAAGMGVALLVGYALPVRSTDHTSSITFDVTSLLLTIVVMAVLLRTAVLQTAAGLSLAVLVVLAASMSGAYVLDRHRGAAAA